MAGSAEVAIARDAGPAPPGDDHHFPASHIPGERLAVIQLLEERIAAVSARTRHGLREAARAVHPELQPVAIVLLR